MKPILLRLSGLQSYREAQEVDFERLCEAGVFGIFGSTGSGKSSILDAMTLALYGRVERAANGTQGIMNQAEKQLAVSFTFDMGGGDGRRRYRVERQFKRGGEVAIASALSRFIEVTEAGDVVLADKTGDVTRCVEERIGLNMQDFTRAVVLPQGKFAEFLSLTGKDRRQMLQRLFRLERFGDGLALKLSQRMKAAESALNEAAAEQQGLGDASAAAVDAAAALHREAAAAAAIARAALADAERLHAERLHVRERQEAQRAKEALQAKLHADAPRIAALERELQRLAAAERLTPALAAAEAAEAALTAAASRREAAGLAHAARLEAAAAAAAAWSAASAEAAAAEPRLALRLDQLAQAQRLEGEAAALAAAAAGDERRCADAAMRQRSFGDAAAKAQETLGRALAKQNELKAELKTAQLTTEERGQRSIVAKRLRQVEALSVQMDNARRECELQAQKLAVLRQATAAAEAERDATAAELDGHLSALQPVQSELMQLEKRLQQLSETLPQWLERMRDNQREQQHAQLAAQLAAELRQGEPCPVCGSCAHPQPGTQGDAAPSAHLISQWERAQQGASALLLRITPLHSKAESAHERLREALPAEDDKLRADNTESPELAWENEAAAALSHITAANQDLPDEETLHAIQALLSAVSDASAAHEQWLSSAAAKFRASHTRSAEAVRSCELAASELRSQALQDSEYAAKYSELAAAMDGELKEWSEQFGPELHPEEARQLLVQYEQRENAAHELNNRLERSVTFIEEVEQQAGDNEKLAQAAQLEAVELTARLEHQRQQLLDKEARLKEWTNGKPSAALLAEAERELAGIRSQLTRLKDVHETAQAALQEAAEQRSAAVESARNAESRQLETAGQWQAALAPSPFQSADEVRALQPMLSKQADIAGEIDGYRETESQLSAQIALLREQLQGRAVTDEDWEQCVGELKQARISNESALQASAKAERDLEELAAKQDRWQQLETARLATEQLCVRLKSLQSVFRGNAFVEYVAEEQLVQVCRTASERLGFLTKRRYALEVDSGGGFVIRDDANGGIRRPVSSLSGGETFLASLALALALSGQIQLRGKYPLQFFFLDEGFGTLDPELLDTVISALEKLQSDTLSVGVISHVPELRARLPRRLIVTAAQPAGRGSQVALETM
ncbi:AAA family ATPase [Paenibacillus oenotherae]|uniref:Nuclease SbcCD subunit C n=1 Tax=Paenibacillus oenotherae TaxID=1435645 RepID=A0ABS7D2S0_9BACL|nr:AAA family ATPase [Paenibacillus oenotherae]MBW7473721.1 AAA family ATPase [Paenibacillus oenotherae]